MNSPKPPSRSTASVPPAPKADLWGRARTLLALQRQVVANSSIVEIQPKGNRPPLFLVHGVGGGMLWGYNNLARQLGDEQPIYAFKSRGLEGFEEFKTIEEMAAQYTAELRAFQPQGPYHLGGYCFGGNVAYEMARELKAQGQEVAFLLLMNCWPNNSSYTRLSWSPVFVAKFLWNLGVRLKNQVRQGAQHPRHYFKWRTAWLGKKLRAFFSQKIEDKVAVEDIVDLSPQPENERKLWRTHVQTWLRYQPKPYDGHVVLFRTRGHPLVCSFDHQMGWGSFAAGGVTVKICRGDHESILEEENVAFTAQQLKAVLVAASEKIPEPLQLAGKSDYPSLQCNRNFNPSPSVLPSSRPAGHNGWVTPSFFYRGARRLCSVVFWLCGKFWE
jgi:thioesterase domain-containing protein